LDNNNQKNLLLVSAMCASCDVNGLKEQMQKMVAEKLVTNETFEGFKLLA